MNTTVSSKDSFWYWGGGIAALFTPDRLDAWKDWLAFHVVRSLASSLSDAFVQANFDFYGRTLTGTPEIRARWKRGVTLVEVAP